MTTTDIPAPPGAPDQLDGAGYLATLTALRAMLWDLPAGWSGQTGPKHCRR